MKPSVVGFIICSLNFFISKVKMRKEMSAKAHDIGHLFYIEKAVWVVDVTYASISKYSTLVLFYKMLTEHCIYLPIDCSRVSETSPIENYLLLV